MNQHTRLIAGAMSGTSADGVDIAITRITGRGVDMTAQLVQHHHRAYTPELRKEIFAFRGDEARDNFLPRLAKLGQEISLTYAAAVNEALATASLHGDDLAAVAAHGQTLFHDPPNTIQWFDPTIVAAEVGCPVISDFRRADLAAGGQGAPLVPFADYILFRHPTKNRVLLNIGGIANITYLRAGGTIDEVIAFDTGPGNCLSDYVCRKYDPGGPGYDIDGQGAERGWADDCVVEVFLQSPYFAKGPPKSTDGPQMIALFERALQACGAASKLSFEDALDCATTATGISIANTIRSIGDVDEVIFSGGGSKNKAICSTASSASTSVWAKAPASDAKEALAFALLGAATLDGVPSNVPSVTGARRAVVLGSITPKP